MDHRNPFAKEWDACFTKDRGPEGNTSYDTPYVDSKRDLQADHNGINLFLRDFDDSVLCHVDEVERFCENASLGALLTASGPSGSRRGAWLDDRSFCDGPVGGGVREYRNPLTAAALYQCLKRPRYKLENHPDADRRLIYIPNLDGNYITALAETAAAHQVDALRDAIRQHLALQTSIQVHMRKNVNFTLVLHLPHFRLKKSSSPTGFAAQQEAADRSPHRDWTELAFLNSPGPKADVYYAVYKARDSLVLCGSGDRHWIGYAFVDRDFDDEDMDEDDFSYEGFSEDPITSYGNDTLDANCPIKDPRDYFLRVLEIQSKKVLREWENLIWFVERAINHHVSLIECASQTCQ
jgi:hypothetical protein